MIPQVKANRLRALFVTPVQLPELPGVPSAREAGYPEQYELYYKLATGLGIRQ